LANPWTGKTSFARVCGRMLKGLGLLADGAVECKLPADFTGAVVGESEEKTTSILLEAVRWGGARDIRGLHTLNEYSSFGRIVPDTIVSHVHDAPGEDVAVLRLGHEKQMKERLLEASPRLDSRFGVGAGFADFTTDSELEQVARRGGLRAPRAAVKAAAKHLSRQRSRARCGDARLAVSFVCRRSGSRHVAARGR